MTHTSDDDPIDSALSASSKTGESLTKLLQALGEFQGSVNGARDTQERLQIELEHVRDLLGRTNTERLALKNRVAALEAELRERGEVTEQDARYLQDEQDRFIAALLDEYDELVAGLRAERDEALAKLQAGLGSTQLLATIPSPAPDKSADDDLVILQRQVETLIKEREQTRSLIKRAQAQRDAAQTKAERLEEQLARVKRRASLDDKHTRPTDPPPDSKRAKTSADTPTERPPKNDASEPDATERRASRKRSNPPAKPAKRPRSRDLQLSELEEEWDRTTTPAPPPSYEGALDETMRTPRSLRQPSPPAELRAALTSPSVPASKAPSSTSKAPSSSLPRVIAAGARPVATPRTGLYASPTLPKMTPSLEEATKPPATNSGPSQPPSTMGYPADKKPPLKRKPDPLQRPLVGYSKSGSEVREEHIVTRSSGTSRTRE